MPSLMNGNPKTIVLLQVRLQSKRLPRKVLAPIAGKPVVVHLIERVKQARIPGNIVLCTSNHPDDAILTEIAAEEGVQWFEGSEDDVLDRFIQAGRRDGADIVVRATGDNPLTDPVYMDRLILHHIRTEADYTYVEGLPRGTKPEVFSLSALEKAWELAEDTHCSEYMTAFVNRPEVFHVEKIIAEEPVRRPEYRLTIDEPDDLELVRKIYARLYHPPGRVFALEEVIQLLEEHPDIPAINAGVKASPAYHAKLCRKDVGLS